MTLSFDFYFSFRSPYSYLAIPQIEAMIRQFDVSVVLRIVRPIAVRIPGFFERADPLRTPYMRRDAVRTAEVLGLPYRWPRPDPILMDEASGKVAEIQPYIDDLSRLGAAACELGFGFAWAGAISRLLWSGEVDDWHLGDHIDRAAGLARLDFRAVRALAQAAPERLNAAIRANEAAQRDAGHWGVPLFVFENEPFFGQDRIDHMMFRMHQRGLSPRTAAL